MMCFKADRVFCCSQLRCSCASWLVGMAGTFCSINVAMVAAWRYCTRMEEFGGVMAL